MLKKLRKNLISKPLMKFAKKNIPPLSSTEKEAGEAGTKWWESEIISGNPDWKKLHPIPAPALSGEEETFLNGQTEELCRMLNTWEINKLKDLPDEVWEFMKEKGFFGMIIPKKYGGLQFSAQGHSAVVQKISTRNLAAAVTVMVPNSLGPAELLLQYGTEEQKNYYLPRLASGKEIPCFALTEPEAGSDASSIKSNGVVCWGEFEGNKTLGIRLNWEKRYITLGPVATILGLAFKLYDPEHLLSEKENIGITLALIPTWTKGIKIGTRHNAMDCYFQVGPNWGNDVFIPIDWIIGGKERVGQGWKMLMNCLGVGRSISLPALSAGSAKLAAATAGAYARVRKQFKTPIANFEGIKIVLAEIGADTYVIDAIRSFTASAVDMGGKPSVASAIVKYHSTELGRKIIINAMDILGGSGICQGPRNILGETYKSQPVGITVEGANILNHSMIIPAQLLMRCHPYLRKEMEALAEPNPDIALEKFDEIVFQHIVWTAKNIFRSIVRGLTGGRLAAIPEEANIKLECYYRLLSKFSANIALVADVSAMLLGGKLKKKEALSARIGDIVSELYKISSVLKRFNDEGENEHYLPFVHMACQNSLRAIQESFYELFRNFPIRPAAWALKQIVFPWGRIFEKPSDKLRFEAANKISGNAKDIENLVKGIYIPSDWKNEPLGMLEAARQMAIKIAPMEKKIAEEKKNGTYDNNKIEIRALNEMIAAMDNLRRRVVQVDDFEKL